MMFQVTTLLREKFGVEKHSQWPPKSFRLSPGLRVYAAFYPSFLGCLKPLYLLALILNIISSDSFIYYIGLGLWFYDFCFS